MSHPVVLACLDLTDWFGVSQVCAIVQMSSSGTRHRLDDLASIGVLSRKVNHQRQLRYKIADLPRLKAIRDGIIPMPTNNAEKVARQAERNVDTTLPLAELLGYHADRLKLLGKRLIEREEQHNPDLTPRVGHIYGHSSLEIV
jgi:hypothetical protein